MKTETITKKLSIWGDPEASSYGQGVYLTDSFYSVDIYNLTQIDRLIENIPNKIRDGFEDKIYATEDREYIQRMRKQKLLEINQALEPLRQNVKKATQALDNYLRIAGQQAKEIVIQELQK